MPRDLGQLLHDTAVTPSEPVDPGALVARGRRRRRRRTVAVVGSAAVVALTAGLAVSSLVTPEGPDVVLGPPVGEEPSQRPELGEHVEREAPTVALADVDRPLLVHDEAGIRRVAGGDDQRLWDAPVATALPDLRGGVVFQDPEDPSSAHEGWGFGTIRWLPAGRDAPAEPAIAGADERPVLHAVVDLDGEPTVLFTRRSGDLQGEDQVETLYARGLETGVERELGVTGRLESGLDSAGMADDHLVITTCHLHCSIRVVPPGTAPDADGATELDPPAVRYGLDVEGNVAGYVELTPSDDLAHATPALVLRVLARAERTDIPLPTIEARAETVGAQTDLAPDLTAALIHLTWHDVAQDVRERRTLLVDRLDTQPRVRLLDTDHTLRFDVRP